MHHRSLLRAQRGNSGNKMTLLLFFFSIFFAITPIISMEREFDLQVLPDAAAIIVVASCENKNALRQTCKRFSEFASRRKNENILMHPQLYLTQEALDRYLLYYGALGNINIVCNLLAKGANPNVTEDNGIPLIHYVMVYGYSEIENMLRQHSDFKTIDFINDKNICFLPMVQSKQSSIKLNFSDDGDALYYAVKNGLYTMVRDLLAGDMGPENIDKEMFDCLSHSDVQFGGDQNMSPFYYCINSLHSATHNGHVNIMKLLLDKGAYVNGRGSGYHIPLYTALLKGHTSAVQLLIDYGACIDMRYTRYRYTPLGCAVDHKYVQITKMLLENGADIEEVNLERESALCIAKDDAMKQLLNSYKVEEEPRVCVIQ